MGAIVAGSRAGARFTMTLLAVFATAALVLGAIGIYGVAAYAVTRRTREIGVRMALGARRRDVMAMVMQQSSRLAAIGLAGGLGGALVTGRLAAGLLYGVRPTDPVVLVAVGIVLGIVALVASAIPARRASRIDPVIAMRVE